MNTYFFIKKNGAIRCNLVHSRPHFSLHYFAVFDVNDRILAGRWLCCTFEFRYLHLRAVFLKLKKKSTTKTISTAENHIKLCYGDPPVYTDSHSNKLYMLKS